MQTATSADFMKPWIDGASDDSSEDEEIESFGVRGRTQLQDGRV